MKSNCFIVRLIVAALLSLTVAACGGADKELSIVPADVSCAVKIDIHQLWQKGELDNMNNLAFVKLLRQEIDDDNPQLGKLINGLLNDPSSSGIDTHRPVVAYTIAAQQQVSDDTYLVIGALLKSEKDFESFLAELARRAELSVTASQYKKFCLATFDEEYVVAWNKHKALFVKPLGNQGLKELNIFAGGQMTMDKATSMAANADFGEFWKSNADIAVWTPSATLSSLANDTYAWLKPSAHDSTYVSFGLRFDEGAIVIDAKCYGKNATQRSYLQSTTFNSKLLNFIPDKAYGVTSAVVDWDDLLNDCNMAHDTSNTMNRKIGDGDATVGELAKSLGNSVVVGFHGVRTGIGGTVPLLTLAIDITDNSSLQNVLSATATDHGNGHFSIDNIVKMPLYMVILDSVLVVSTDPALATASSTTPHNALMEFSDSISAHSAYCFIDLCVDHYPTAMTSAIPVMVQNLLRSFSTALEAVGNSDGSGSVRILMTNKSENSLLAILHLLDDNLMRVDDIIASFLTPLDDEEF